MHEYDEAMPTMSKASSLAKWSTTNIDDECSDAN
jgi:hypothetical protein